MALLTFPSSPVNGQLYPVAPLLGQNQYEYEAIAQTWRLLGAATGVLPGTYGDATHVGQFTVDTQGRLTSAVNVPISSSAGGTVTDVTAGVGLLGGTITTSGTLDLDTAHTDTLYLQLTGGTVTGNLGVTGTLGASGLTYPTTDGATGQVMDTDGGGNLGWATVPTVVAVPTSSMDPGFDNQVSFDSSGNFYFYNGLQWWKVTGVAF